MRRNRLITACACAAVLGVFAVSSYVVRQTVDEPAVARDDVRLRASQYPSVEHTAPTAEFPTLSPDGTRLLYVAALDADFDLWISNVDGSNARPLIAWPDSTERHPAWSPDGTRIFFTSTRGSSRPNIWSISPTGSDPIQITSDDADHEHPRVSPDGSRIVYLSNATGKKELWIMNADGSDQELLVRITMLVSDPSWSPTGGEIAYVGCLRGGPCNIFTIDVNGTQPRQLTSGDFQDWTPDWGAAGILFASNRNGSQGLWLVTPDDLQLRQITFPEAVADLDPRWHTLTGAFVFGRSGMTNSDAASDIWFADFAGAVPERITRLQVARAVAVDILPGAVMSSISCRSRGVLPVAVLSSPEFDATAVNADTVRFGKTGTEAREAHTHSSGGSRRHVEDVNKDGRNDLIFHFRFEETGFACADIPAGQSAMEAMGRLAGATIDGQPIASEGTFRLIR